MMKAMTLCLSMMVVATGLAASADARPRRQICHREYHHGHRIRVCHWAR